MDNNLDDKSMLHSDLSLLEKLSEFSFESKMLCSQSYSSRLMDGSKVNLKLAYKENIMPWEIEIFTAYSVMYNNDVATKDIDSKTFSEIITYIRNYWDNSWEELEKTGDYADAFMMRATIQQFPIQGVFLQKLFRYNYFFNFINDNVDMKKVYLDKFGAEYGEFAMMAFIVFLLCSATTDNKISGLDKGKVLTKVFKNKTVFSLLCIDKEEYIANMQKMYKSNIVQLYYGLKAHYWWPFIGGETYIYIPSPYLVINAVTDSMLNRLTLGNDALRHTIGKEVIETYLYDIYKQVDTVTWISNEIDYKIGSSSRKTSDVLVGENDYCTFYDTKSMVPSLKIRTLDKKEINESTEIYADAIIQIFKQIKNYNLGHFQLDKKYAEENLFGVVVMLESIALSREKMYLKAFELYEDTNGTLSAEEKDYIHSHIKLVSLSQIETLVLENNSFLPSLLNQANTPSSWNDLNFESSYECKGLIPIYEKYVMDIKSEFKEFVTSADIE
ncbi:MAG: hypothetical protein R3Y47_12050 [Lachnospiraceae bacterium]